MKIVFASSEIAPYAKTGGLADVSSALPKYIDKTDFDVISIMPLYSSISRKLISPARIEEIKFHHGKGTITAGIFSSAVSSESKVYFIDYPPFFEREGIYGKNSIDYDDNDNRFSMFCRAVLETCRMLNFRPDVIHCNDWQTGLIPVYLKTVYRGDRFFGGTKVLFTIHNLSYKGLFNSETALIRSGLPGDVYNMYGVEFYGSFSFLKGGIYYSDLINTVSSTYSSEIQGEEYGEGMQGLLRSRSSSLSGIINGVDYGIWNPADDPLIKKNFSITDIQEKRINTEELCMCCGVEYQETVPVTGMVTRLTGQKGLDILTEVMDSLMQRDVRFILLGTGEDHYHRIFNKLAAAYPGRLSVNLKYDEELSHLIYAGCDIFLIPSKFEPCGISQMISLKYGTIPVARETGGLADTIRDCYSKEAREGEVPNGFLFRNYSGKELLNCIDRALRLFKKRDEWKALMYNAMNCDFSWRSSAEQYEALYRKLAPSE